MRNGHGQNKLHESGTYVPQYWNVTEQECKLSQIGDAGCAAVTICTLSTHAYLFSNKLYNCSQGIKKEKKSG